MDIALSEFRKKYPQYNNWEDARLSRAIQKKHEAEGVNKSEKGWTGIGNDIEESLESLPGAAIDFAYSIPGGIRNAGKYAISHNPVETLGNLGAGGVESLAGLASAPEAGLRWLGNKFPSLAESVKKARMEEGGNGESKTFHEMLMDFERNHGLQSRSEEEGSVRNLGGLLFGGKGLSKLKNPVAQNIAIAGEQAGRGGDPLHAMILSALGQTVAKAPWKETINAPSSFAESIRNTPEILGKGAASLLETAADVGTKLHVPGIQPTLGALSSYLKHKSVPPEKYAARQLFGDISQADLPMIEERIKAAKRLGLDYLTPAEATLSPFEAAKQGQVGRTSSGSKLMFEKGKLREKSEETAINNLFDTIYSEKKLAPEMEKAYKQTMSKSVSDDFIEKHSSDPLITHAMKELDSNPVYKKALGNIPKTSFEYWDHVKRVLGDMEESAKNGTGRKPYQASVIGETRRNIVNEMDKIEPEYKKARNISEREFTRRKLEGLFDKKSMTGNNFYKFLQSDKNFNSIMSKLKAFPEAQSQLKDMRLLFGDLIPGNPSIRTAAQMKRTGMWDSRNKLDALKQALDEKYGQEHDVATINLMTHPKLLERLKEHLNK